MGLGFSPDMSALTSASDSADKVLIFLQGLVPAEWTSAWSAGGLALEPGGHLGLAAVADAGEQHRRAWAGHQVASSGCCGCGPFGEQRGPACRCRRRGWGGSPRAPRATTHSHADLTL